MSSTPTPQPPVEGRPNNHASIMGLQGFLLALSLLIVSLRVWVRATLLNTFSWDDWFIILSMMFSIAVFGCFIAVLNNGGGHYVQDIGVPEEWEALQHWEHVLLIINITGVSVVKISLSLALLRFLYGRWYQIFLKSFIVFVILFTIGTEAPLIFRCWPTYYIWAIQRPPGVCIPTKEFLIVANINASLNIITDALLVMLPIPTIITLKVNVQTKASLIAVICIGFVAVAAAIVRAVAANIPAQISDSWSLKFYVWNSIELNLGIVAASIPTLRPLFSSIFESATSRLRGSYGRSRSDDAAGGGPGRSHLNGSNHRASRAVVNKYGYKKQRENQIAESYAMGETRDWSGSMKNNEPVIISSSRAAYGLEDNSSEEEILRSVGMVKGGIRKQTDVVVSKSDA